MCGPSICKKPHLKWWPFLLRSTTVPCCKSTDPCFNPLDPSNLHHPPPHINHICLSPKDCKFYMDFRWYIKKKPYGYTTDVCSAKSRMKVPLDF